MSERIRSLVTYFAVFIILLFTLALISPNQFEAIIDIFSQSGDLFLVLVVIAFVVYLLKKLERF